MSSTDTQRTPRPATTDRPMWRRGSAIVALTLSAVVLTAGAALVQPTLFVGAEGTRVDADLTIPVNYTTQSGQSVACTYGIYFNPTSGRSSDLEDDLRSLADENWDGFGEAVKQYAIENPFTPPSDPGWANADRRVLERMAFEEAIDVIIRERAHGVISPDAAVLTTSDCSGELS